MAADGAEQAETYLRLLAEAELRRAPVFHGPGSQPHRVSLAATALASAGALTLDTAWQVVADFQAACALRLGDPVPAVIGPRSPRWPARPPGSLAPSSRPSAIRHSVVQFLGSSYRLGWTRPTAASATPPAPGAIPVGATLPLPAERDGWFGEHHLLALARTDTAAAITVATRWAGQTRRSAAPRPRHAPFHEVGAVDDRGVSYRAALWDMGIEDGREWWDCHLALTPVPPDGTRWLDIGPGARGRCIRVELAPPDLVTGIETKQAGPDGSAAARLLDRAGDELLAGGPGRQVAGLPLASRVGLLITDLTESGALAASDPAVGRLHRARLAARGGPGPAARRPHSPRHAAGDLAQHAGLPGRRGRPGGHGRVRRQPAGDLRCLVLAGRAAVGPRRRHAARDGQRLGAAWPWLAGARRRPAQRSVPRHADLAGP